MEISTKYNPKNIEDKWYKYWLDNKLFESKPDNREPYTIVIPPPNVTGVLHMGHMLNNTIQDVLVRRARMLGKNALWVPGTDHASIATEAKVVNKLKKDGINKNDLSRNEFLKYAWEWKEKHGGIILEQLKKLGASCDWSRTKFTMDKDLSESVIKVFVDLYNKGLIYRGVRMVNWDPSALTAISDEEVIYKEEQSKLYYIRYKINGENDYITIATTRPETILGDSAVCINPNDKRFSHLKGKKVVVPLINRVIPIITDEYVDMEFGTGCLKITPAHDIHDYEIGIKHNLEIIDIIDDNGKLNSKAQIFVNQDRFDVRKNIIPELEKAGNLVKIEDYVNKVGYSERTNVVIEPKLSMQWFVKMKDLVKPATENVINDNIKFFPKKFKNTYRHWMENVKDWNISRQLWWGHRIPAYYIKDTNDFVVAETIEQALELAKQKTNDNNLTIKDLHQDEDVLDTWFSSWLWPITVFDGIRNPDNDEIKYYYPTNDLVTAPEIIFFWVARMIISGYEYRNDKPFKNVYFTGIVRDKLRRKMSKSLGNSPDPIKLIEKYGADGVRVGMLLCSPAGNDLMFDESLTEQGRNFSNKIWNAFRLIKSWKVDKNIEQPESSKIAVDWFDNILSKSLNQINENFNKFRLSESLMIIYKLFWDEFSSWYLEIIKPEYQKPIDKITYEKTIDIFEKLLKILHPFMPFITEELWQTIKKRNSIMIAEMPKQNKNINNDLINNFDFAKEIISNIRNIRNNKNIPNKEKLSLKVKSAQQNTNIYSVIKKLANIDDIEFVSNKISNTISFIVGTTEFYIPFGDIININEEIKKLEEELKYQKGFLISVEKKLSNERFVNNAPKNVVDNEKKKLTDANNRIKSITEQIKILKNN